MNDASALDETPASDPAKSALREIFSKSFDQTTRRLIDQTASARLGEPEGVHQARSAGRRLRALLWTFRPLLDPDWTDALDQELGRFVHTLGRSRDLDVFAEDLNQTGADLAADLQPLRDDLAARRASAREELDRTLADPSFPSWIDRLIAAAEAPRTADSTLAAEFSAKPKLLSRLARRAWKPPARSARELDETSPDEEFHRVRKRVKRARYAAEAIVSGLSGRSGRRARRFARRLAKVQDILGKHQDAVVACEWIAESALAHPENPRFLIAAGRLIERYRQTVQKARAAFFSAWKRLDRPKLRKWDA